MFAPDVDGLAVTLATLDDSNRGGEAVTATAGLGAAGARSGPAASRTYL